MRLPLRRPLAAVTAALLLLVLAGCGDDDDSASDETTTTADEAAESTEGEGSTEGDGATESGGGGDAGAVTISGFDYDPTPSEVGVGTEVTWTNDDEPAHTVTAEDGSFDSGDLAPGDTFSQTFEEAGTFAYVCSIHPNMSGEVVVE